MFTTVGDADTPLQPQFFRAVTFESQSLTEEKRSWSIWQPPNLTLWNFNTVPRLTRVALHCKVMFAVANLTLEECGFPADWLIDVEMRNAGCLWWSNCGSWHASRFQFSSTLTGHIGYFLQHHTQHLFHPFEEQCRQPTSVSSQTNATLRCEAPSQFPASEVEMVSTSGTSIFFLVSLSTLASYMWTLLAPR